jgi:superfamily I DNA and RNA helicase
VKSNEDYPYQYFLEQNLYLDASVRFIGEEEYRNFLVDIINKIKDEEEAIDYESIITDICQNAIND